MKSSIFTCMLAAAVGMAFLLLIFVIMYMPTAQQQREIDKKACLAAGRDTASCVQPTILDGVQQFVDFYHDLQRFNTR